MQTSEILHRAADLIEERGWDTGPDSWVTYGVGPLCIEGALAAAIGKTAMRARTRDDFIDPAEIQICPAGAAVREFLGERRLGDGWLCHWNDYRARNAAEVIEVLRAAAAVQELREADAAPIPVAQTVEVGA